MRLVISVTIWSTRIMFDRYSLKIFCKIKIKDKSASWEKNNYLECGFFECPSIKNKIDNK